MPSLSPAAWDDPDVAALTRAGYAPTGAFGHYLGEDAAHSLFFARTLA